ncbi:hypothetical protein GBAR_LOCUS4785 [Geodia barretti]|uniref:Uncharacterized protein n=1 Tax=Geodia barretti TaxID=519541 RepID=A0AA35R8F6_GEOBA|nr:hypothetical protein GBAR_LOCUS4785 [Geodia barretti]
MYDISIVGTSEHISSESVEWETATQIPVPACESSGSSSSVAVAALGGVLGVVIVTAIAVQVMVIVFFMKKLQRAEKCTTTAAGPLKRAPPESFKTTSNEAYSAVREETGGNDDAYETVMP